MKHAIKGLFVAGLLFTGTAAFGQYVAYDLGTLGGNTSAPHAINDLGTVVGIADTAGGAQHAFVYENGVMNDLGTLGGSFSTARDINNNGMIVGWANPTGSGAYHAFSYQNGVMTDLGTLGGHQFLCHERK